MPRPPGHSSGRRHMRLVGMMLAAAAGVAGFVLAAITGMAIARTFVLKAEKNVAVTNETTHTTKHETIAATSHDVAVYRLGGETSHRLLCKSATCLAVWPPVKVRTAHVKLSKAPGVKGKLGVIHRGGFFQLTLNGDPLYTYSIDRGRKGIATGEGVMSFGGTWHVIVPSGGSSGTSGATTPPPAYPPY